MEGWVGRGHYIGKGTDWKHVTFTIEFILHLLFISVLWLRTSGVVAILCYRTVYRDCTSFKIVLNHEQWLFLWFWNIL